MQAITEFSSIQGDIAIQKYPRNVVCDKTQFLDLFQSNDLHSPLRGTAPVAVS